MINRTLSHQRNFLNEMFGTGKFIDDKQHITDIDGDVTALVGVVLDVAHGAFPATIEVQTQ